MNYAEIFGANVKYYRKKLGLTQLDLAEKTSYERSSIGRIEQGQVDVPLSRIVELANALECTPGELTEWNAAISDDGFTERFLSYAKALNKMGKEKAIERMEELSEMGKYTDDN